MEISRLTFILVLLLTSAGMASLASAETGTLNKSTTVAVVPPPMMPAPTSELPIPEPQPAIEKVSPGVFRIGQVTINKQERSITFPAQINMDKGLLEYLLVRNGGKTHESLLRTKAEPYQLQLACLLLGFEGTSRPLAFQGAPETPTGEPVTIAITLMDSSGRARQVLANEWISAMQDTTPVPVNDVSMVFTGSIISEGRFMAQIDGSMIALYHDPVAIIDNSSPGGEIHNHWAVREGVVPPVGTPVIVTIRPAK